MPMVNRKLALCCAITILTSITTTSRADDKAAERAFTLKVLPLLKAKCLGCHGEKPDDLKGDFDVRSRAALLKGGESGEAALVPGKPDDSPLLKAIQWDGLEMPPKENDRLTAAQIELVKEWVAAGGPWPSEAEQQGYREAERAIELNDDGMLMKTSGGLSDEWTFRRYRPEDLWAFRQVKRLKIDEQQLLIAEGKNLNHHES
ncbi:MAG: hypothetical protein O2856_20190, partial [Planctomycetota bacterium]|nr:hypothetical protein [Planctomycetota bacterium]